MSYQVKRHDVAAWLRRNGFIAYTRGGTGHIYFEHVDSGVKIALPGHGPSDLSKKVMGNVVRAIVKAGFDREHVRRELHGEECV